MWYVFFALRPVSSFIDLKYNKDSANVYCLILLIDIRNGLQIFIMVISTLFLIKIMIY